MGENIEKFSILSLICFYFNYKALSGIRSQIYKETTIYFSIEINEFSSLHFLKILRITIAYFSNFLRFF